MRFKEKSRRLPAQIASRCIRVRRCSAQGTEVPAIQRGNLEMSTMTTFEVAQQIPEYGLFNRALSVPRLRPCAPGAWTARSASDYIAAVADKMGIEILAVDLSRHAPGQPARQSASEERRPISPASSCACRPARTGCCSAARSASRRRRWHAGGLSRAEDRRDRRPGKSADDRATPRSSTRSRSSSCSPPTWCSRCSSRSPSRSGTSSRRRSAEGCAARRARPRNGTTTSAWPTRRRSIDGLAGKGLTVTGLDLAPPSAPTPTRSTRAPMPPSVGPQDDGRGDRRREVQRPRPARMKRILAAGRARRVDRRDARRASSSRSSPASRAVTCSARRSPGSTSSPWSLFLWAVFLTAASSSRSAITSRSSWSRHAPVGRPARISVAAAAVARPRSARGRAPTIVDFVAFLWRERTAALQWRLDFVYACFRALRGGGGRSFPRCARVRLRPRWCDRLTRPGP